jgi:hypothetical protein
VTDDSIRNAGSFRFPAAFSLARRVPAKGLGSIVTITYRGAGMLGPTRPERVEDGAVEQPPARTVLAWALWLATIGCCAAGLAVALLVARPCGGRPTRSVGCTPPRR